MRLGTDENYRSNYKVMRNCALVRIMEIGKREDMFKARELDPYANWLDLDPSAQPFKEFLAELYKKHAEDDQSKMDEEVREGYILNPNALDLLHVTARSSDYIPPRLLEQYAEHARLREKSIRFTEAANEYRDLVDIIDSRDYQGAYSYLNNPQHSSNFKKFADSMKSRNQMALCKIYKGRAEKIAEEAELEGYVGTRLNRVFTPKQVSLTLKDLGRNAKMRFTGKVLKFAMPLLAGAIIGGSVVSNFAPNRDVSNTVGTETHFSGSPSIPSDMPLDSIPFDTTDPSIIGEKDEFVPPISNSIAITSYSTACQDFYQKTAEVYKYCTGKDVDLSYLGQSNMDKSTTTVFVVTKDNGETVRFSAQSPYITNQTYLEQALMSTGLEYTKEQSTKISYIFDNNGKSLAITDSAGNPIKSGSILERNYGNNGEMYNQTYVNAGRRVLEERGIDTSGKSEAELVGAYITSDSYNVQDPDLSRALGVTQDLLGIIKSSFYYRNGQEDAYAYNYAYANASKKFAEKFNNMAKDFYDRGTMSLDVVDGLELLNYDSNTTLASNDLDER